ncbi:hypothetical protein BH18ACI3_BH18ACI3_21520 [soil metagenome]
MPKKWELKDGSGKKLTITIAEKAPSTEQYQAEKSEDSAALTEAPAESKEEITLENSTHIVTITIAE